MTVRHNTFAGGTDTVALTGGSGGNTAGASGDYFDVVTIGTSATVKFDSAHPAHGALGLHIATSTSTSAFVSWTTQLGGTPGTLWFRIYLYFTANPTNNTVVARFVTSGGTQCARLVINTAGKILFADSASTTQLTSTATIPLNQMFRIEGFVVGSATVGQLEFKLFDVEDNPVADETKTSGSTLNTTGAMGQAQWGQAVAGANIDYRIGDVASSDVSYLGPVVDTGTGGVQVKKPSLFGNGPLSTTGSGGVKVKKPSLQGLAREFGTGGVRVKKPSLAGSGGLRISGSGGVKVKKPSLFGAQKITGSGGVQAKKPFLQGAVRITGTGSIRMHKMAIKGFRRTLVTVQQNGLWINCVVKARIGGVWVPVTTKIMIDGTWFTIGLDSEGQPQSHGNVFVKKPMLSGAASQRISGSGGVTIKKPHIQGSQHFSTTGSGGVIVKKPMLKGNGRPGANTILLGVNNLTTGGETTFATYSSVIPNVTTTRFYNQGSDGPNGIPSAWPSAPIPSGAIHFVVSIRPTDLDGFIAGTYDAATKVWLRKIPAGHYITCYHEANLSANIFQTTAGGTPAKFRAMNQKLKALAVAVQAENPGNPKVNVGIIIGSANVGVDNTPWIPTGMDFYGMDGYGGVKDVLAGDRFGPNIAAILAVQPGATMAIIENNDKTATDPARWNKWFTDCFNLALSYNMCIFMTWWGPTATYSNAENFNPTGTYVSTLHDLYASI